MGILAWIVLGLVAGWIASMLMKGGGYGIVGDIVLGVLGALVGGFLSSMLFGIDVTGFNLTSVIIAVLGAMLLIAISRAVGGRRTHGTTI